MLIKSFLAFGAGFISFLTPCVLPIIPGYISYITGKKLDEILQPLHHSMFVESNPSPVKYAAKLLNLCDDDVRLPLVKVTDPTKEIVKKALQSAKLI